MPFLEHFGADREENQAMWQRTADPVVSLGAHWCREFIAPSSILIDDDRITLFAEGGAHDRESIGVFTNTLANAFEAQWEADPSNPVLAPSAGGFDCGSVFDPAVIRVGKQLRVYYSATCGGAHEFAEHSSRETDERPAGEFIGVAVRGDHGFERQPSPVIPGRCPYVIEHDGDLYLFYVEVVAGGYRIFAAHSADGTEFERIGDGPVLDVGEPQHWDSFTVTTPKVFRDGRRFVMLYAGDADRIDDPTGIGIALSDDLLHWERHPGNPVFVVGRPGSFDSVSVASPVPFVVNGTWHIAYAGGDRSVTDGLRSQIGVARLGGA